MAREEVAELKAEEDAKKVEADATGAPVKATIMDNVSKRAAERELETLNAAVRGNVSRRAEEAAIKVVLTPEEIIQQRLADEEAEERKIKNQKEKAEIEEKMALKNKEDEALVAENAKKEEAEKVAL